MLFGFAVAAGQHQPTVTTGAYECDDFADERIVPKIACHGVEALGKHAHTEKQRSISITQPMQLLPRRAAPSQADNVQANEVGDMALGKAERNDIAGGARQTGHHDALADADILMDRGMAAEKDVVADSDVTAEDDVIGEGDVVADMQS